jgi:hypothetical protein
VSCFVPVHDKTGNTFDLVVSKVHGEEFFLPPYGGLGRLGGVLQINTILTFMNKV